MACFSWVYPVLDSLCLLDLIHNFLFHVGEIFNSSDPFFFSSSSGTPVIQMLVHLILSQRSLRLSSILFILFTLFHSSEVISTIFSSSSLIRSSASDILLLTPSRVFLNSIIVLFVPVCLFFNSSRSFLIDSYIFSILFSRVLIIFTVIILNYFSGSLPISSSFILDFCVSSLFLHLCSISLPVHFFFNLLCLRSPFPRLQS